MPRNTSVTLGDHFDEFVREAVAAGRYQSVSEVVRAGLRKLEEDEHRLALLRSKLIAGEESPVARNVSSGNFLKKLHKKHLD